MFDYLLLRVKSIVIIQRRVRGFIKRCIYVNYHKRRKDAANLIQRIYRISRSMKVARYLRVLQRSEWEQLWEKRRAMCYYYNRVTGATTFKEPKDGELTHPFNTNTPFLY